MNDAGTSWDRRRWVSVSASLALLHAGVFWILARFPSGPALDQGTTPVVARWTGIAPDPLAGGISAPTRFALPGSGGFSADAQRGMPRVEYGLAMPPAAPSFMPPNPDAGHLGNIPQATKPVARTAISLPVAGARPPAGNLVSLHGTVEIAGPSASFALRREIRVPAWTGSDTPQPTRIEFAVNPFGEVVTTRLTLGSGSRDADLAALAAIHEARFAPAGAATTADAFRPDRFAWGVATFHPVATNTVAATPPAR